MKVRRKKAMCGERCGRRDGEVAAVEMRGAVDEEEAISSLSIKRGNFVTGLFYRVKQ